MDCTGLTSVTGQAQSENWITKSISNLTKCEKNGQSQVSFVRKLLAVYLCNKFAEVSCEL